MFATVHYADGAMYFNKGQISTGAQASEVQNVMGVLFSTAAFQGMFNLMSAMPVVGFERSGDRIFPLPERLSFS